MTTHQSRDNGSLMLLHARTLKLKKVSCEQLLSRGPDLSNFLGYRAGGVVKGSQAARLMSGEAKECGKLWKMEDGGLCASMQSVGALGFVKPEARENVRRVLQRLGLLQAGEYFIDSDDQNEQAPLLIIELPPYFKNGFDSPPTLHDDYRPEGYNFQMAENMLNESILPFCKENHSNCGLNVLSHFKVSDFQRIENIEVFERYKRHEVRVARATQRRGKTPTSIKLPGWLQKLSRKNGLCSVSNTVYLLHGTTESKLECIIQEGLKTKFSLDRSGLSYGKGLYFANNACKANQYSHNGGGKERIMLVCRVILGRCEILPSECPQKLFPSYRHDSALAKKGVTQAHHGYRQLHNEFIVYDDCACYPEFVIRYKEF
ncbi:hypothetical protein ACHAWF_013081 [Thalassiosira exigua]